MKKELSEMTLEELWKLFPVFLVAHDNRWKGYYKEIEEMLTEILSNLLKKLTWKKLRKS